MIPLKLSLIAEKMKSISVWLSKNLIYPKGVLFLSVFFLSLMVYAIFFDGHSTPIELTSSEKNRIEKYIKNLKIEDAVGQILMVGVPADYNNYKDVKNVAETFDSMGIGNVIVNGYNYYNPKKYDDITFLNAVIEFNNGIQEKATRSKLALPLLIAADFESPSFTSIRNGLVLPPSALTIAACQNKELTNLNGQLVGLQLRNVGVHIILGPVLDSYNIKQGNRSTLQDRCFASTPQGVVAISSHFIKGLKEGGVAMFAKHFPSHGMVEANPHDMVIPEYEGTSDQLDAEIRPFLQYFKETLDGIMTSHISLSRLGDRLATFSPEFIQGHLRKMGFDRQIIITDDLTSMGAIRKYSQGTKDSFPEFAIKAFGAGHDVLLFSHFSEIDKRSTFSLEDLRSVRKALVNYIRNSESAEKHFRSALTKVISLKVRIAKSLGYKVDELLNNQSRTSFFQVQYGGKEALSRSQAFLQNYGDEIDNGEKLVKRTIREAATIINKSERSANYDLNSYSESSKIVVYVYDEGLDRFRQAIQPLFRNAEFVPLPSEKISSSFQKIRKQIAYKFSKADLVIYTVYDKSDSDLLSSLYKNTKSFSSKIVILCHNSPIIFDNEILKQATVLSTFTNHVFSYDIDLEILFNKLQPRDTKNLPISLGENGKIYNVTSTTFIPPTNIAIYEDLFPKYLVDKRTVEIIRSEKYLISKELIHKGFFLFVNLGILFYVMITSAKGLSELIAKIREKDLFISFSQLFATTFFKNPRLIVPLATIILVDLFFFRAESSQIIKLITHFREILWGS
jgi:beta-N-acetylhexosaminidase